MLAAALLLLGASGAWAVPATAAPARAKPPHIMLVLIDDLGYHNVGFHNPEQISPHINALVKDRAAAAVTQPLSITCACDLLQELPTDGLT